MAEPSKTIQNNAKLFRYTNFSIFLIVVVRLGVPVLGGSNAGFQVLVFSCVAAEGGVRAVVRVVELCAGGVFSHPLPLGIRLC